MFSFTLLWLIFLLWIMMNPCFPWIWLQIITDISVIIPNTDLNFFLPPCKIKFTYIIMINLKDVCSASLSRNYYISFHTFGKRNCIVDFDHFCNFKIEVFIYSLIIIACDTFLWCPWKSSLGSFLYQWSVSFFFYRKQLRKKILIMIILNIGDV